MPYLTPDTVQDTVPFFLQADTLPIRTDSLSVNFGRFEVLPTDSHHILFSIDSLSIPHMGISSFGNSGLPLPFSPLVNSVIFLLFICCLVIFSLVFHREGIAFTNNFKHLLSMRKRVASGFKEQVTTTEAWGEFFMLLQTVLVVAILFFTFLWDKGLYALSLETNVIVFTGLLVVLAVIALLKFLMYRVIGAFFLSHEIRHWSSQYYRLLELLGVNLFVPALFYVFLPELRHIMLIIIVFIFLISRLIIIIGLLNIFVKNKLGGFYFFVYLCGTEVAPYLLCYKGVLSFISMAGNNII